MREKKVVEEVEKRLVAVLPTPTPLEARDSPSLGPRVACKIPCPDGCDRTFSHAPAAVQHGKSCMAGPDAATNEQQRFIEGHTIWTPWPTAETLAACLADREWICPN